VVGLLLRARKHGMETFEKMLYQMSGKEKNITLFTILSYAF
jgi:hypothetical protein